MIKFILNPTPSKLRVNRLAAAFSTTVSTTESEVDSDKIYSKIEKEEKSNFESLPEKD